jgi:DNA-binding NtrC family response regulator
MAFRIYYLDDEVDLLNLFKVFIVSDNVEVTTFTSATEAIACCQHTPPDLFFIDYRLSDTTGDKVAEAIDANIKKILLTGELDMDEVPLFEQVIKKPFKLSYVKNVVEQILAKINI